MEVGQEKVKAETGVMLPQNKKCPGWLADTRGWKRQEVILPWRLRREHGGANTLILHFRPQDWESINFCCLSHPVRGTLLQQLQGTNMATVISCLDG